MNTNAHRTIGQIAVARFALLTLASNLLLLSLPAVVQAQFTYETNNGAITITGYTGPGGDVSIPSTINVLPVTSIGDGAFYGNSNLTSVIVPNSVTNIGSVAFRFCTSLTAATIPSSVINIENGAFASCWSLTAVMIGDSVTAIGNAAFTGCTNLLSLYFQGNAPSLVGGNVFFGANKATVYYLPGTVGWGTTFKDRPTALWSLPNPLILVHSPSFGVKTNSFGFIVCWATNVPVVVEACTNLAAPVWSLLATNTLTGGWSHFSDPQWTNYPSRIYRLRSQ